MEAGERKVSATELVALAEALGRPIDWFFAESPPAVVSRRRDPAVGGFSRRLDLVLERAARDVAFLLKRRIITQTGRVIHKMPETYEEAENLARWAGAEAELPDGPLRDLQTFAERLGLLGFSLALGSDAGDAASVEVDGLGVAVVNGTTDSGRRRYSLAHELGHHLVGDAYEPTARFAGTEGESMLNAFAARRVAIAIAARFSVSWTAACNHLRNLGLIDSRTREALVENNLVKGELFEFGERFTVELDPPSIPQATPNTQAQ